MLYFKEILITSKAFNSLNFKKFEATSQKTALVCTSAKMNKSKQEKKNKTENKNN